MRIPSQFNDSSLYRPRRGEKNGRKGRDVPGAADAKRRLIRLGVALLLVVVVMREARQPGLYQTFFGVQESFVFPAASPTQGVTPESDPTAPAAINAAQKESDAVQWESSLRWVESMDTALQQAWIKTLIDLKTDFDQEEIIWSGLSSGQINESVSLIESQSDQHSEAVIRRIIGDCGLLSRFADIGRAPADAWQQISSWATILMDSLQAAAISRASDGTFWLSSDRDAFYLSLALADRLTLSESITTGTLALLQQPEIYRGQAIRVAGRLQLAQKKDAQENDAGMKYYWTLWIIPADGGIRPTVVITPELPEVLSQSLTAQGEWNRNSNPSNPDGHIVAIGRFIKRLPYRSSLGADLAPVVIGKVVGARGISSQGGALVTDLSSPQSIDHRSQDAIATGQNATGLGYGWLGIVFAVIGGVAIAGILMYRSAIDAQRTRRLRNDAAHGVTINLGDHNDTSAFPGTKHDD